MTSGHSHCGRLYTKRYSRRKVMWTRASSFPGSTVDDLSYHIIPIIRKKPTNMIIHIGTNS